MRLTIPLILLFLTSSSVLSAPMGHEFTYQGKLKQGNALAEGTFDLRFVLYDVATGGIAATSPLVIENALIQEGVFSVNLDFGGDVFDGTQLWVEVGVREGALTGEFTTLTPRQKLTASPFAIHTLQTVSEQTGDNEFLGFSTGTTTGSAGLMNMLHECQLDFPASKVCSTTDFVNWKTRPGDVTSGEGGSGWMNVESQTMFVTTVGDAMMDQATGKMNFTNATGTPAHSTMNCDGWTSNSSSLKGTRFSGGSGGSAGYSLESCNSSLRVACCNRLP